jgi:hypothetical protein
MYAYMYYTYRPYYLNVFIRSTPQSNHLSSKEQYRFLQHKFSSEGSTHVCVCVCVRVRACACMHVCLNVCKEQVASGVVWEDIACDMDHSFLGKPVYKGKCRHCPDSHMNSLNIVLNQCTSKTVLQRLAPNK